MESWPDGAKYEGDYIDGKKEGVHKSWWENGNKKFGSGDDELYFRIDLNDEISKIQC
jgi:antitoxin component YwqK of YwqJK toxin-antitoxin module